jgi:hypothetical protein
VPVGDKDHGGVSAAPPIALGSFHEPLDLGLGEVLPPPQLGVGTPRRRPATLLETIQSSAPIRYAIGNQR